MSAWSAQTSDFDSSTAYSCCWSPELGLFAVAGDTGAGNGISTSPDGITWTDQPDNPLGSINGIAWASGLGLFVAGTSIGVGADPQIATSPDGINWTARLTPWSVATSHARTVRAIAWSPEVELLVAVGQYYNTGAVLMTSPDGVNWTTQTSAFDDPASGCDANAVCWSPELGLFAVLGQSGNGDEMVQTSPDGVNWTAQSSPFDGGSAQGVCWSPTLGLLVAVGSTSDFDGTVVMTSPDGVNWTAKTSPFNDGFGGVGNGVGECGGVLVVVGDASHFSGSGTFAIMESADGETWVADTSPLDPSTGGYATSVCYSPDLELAVAVGFGGSPSIATLSFAVPIAPPTQVFGGTRFYEAPPWRMVVGDLEDNTLTFLDKLALDRSVTVTRAAARVISGRVPSDNPEVNIPAPPPDDEPFVSEGARLVSCFRREAPSGSNEKPWVIRARGLVLSLTDDADTDHATSTFTAYDPWKYWYRLPVRQVLGDVGDVSYPAGTRANEIIVEQFDLAISNGTLFTDYGQTAFYGGTIENTEPLPDGGDGLAMTFRSGTTLGEMCDLLVATGTCDIVNDPIYDIENRPGLLTETSIYQSAGSFRPNAVMGWDRWPRSLVQLSRQVEGTERANQMQMYAGQGGPPVPLQTDAASVSRFGEYWALQYLPGVPSIAGAETIARRQLALLKDGQYTYALSPASERAPLLFEEYREADTVPVYADERFRDPISGVPVRVESIPIVVGDDQLERVNQMLVSFAPESGS